jgi:hypothetical protein
LRGAARSLPCCFGRSHRSAQRTGQQHALGCPVRGSGRESWESLPIC